MAGAKAHFSASADQDGATRVRTLVSLLNTENLVADPFKTGIVGWRAIVEFWDLTRTGKNCDIDYCFIRNFSDRNCFDDIYGLLLKRCSKNADRHDATGGRISLERYVL